MQTLPLVSCAICGSAAESVGKKHGHRTGREFELRRCGACGHGFVANPWLEYSKIYDVEYYEGRGSDPLVDYAYEFNHPEKTVRRYEWRGILRGVSALSPAPARWLDYGCGNGGLVRYVRQSGSYEIAGFDTGAWAEKARAQGLPILQQTELGPLQGAFDIVTAIEVLEHCVDPLAELRTIRRLLKPGGILFLITGNADSAPPNFTDWRYVAPEIHISYFTPKSLSLALARTGFAAFPKPDLPGRTDILRFKILKNFKRRNCGVTERILPWPLLARIGDRVSRFSAMPLGRAI